MLPAATPRQTTYCPQTRDLVTLRVTVVKRCVEAAVWQQWHSTPWAARKQWSPAFHSANGFKETRMEDGALFLECFLKVDRPEADKVLAKNGQGAVFVSRLASEQGRKLPVEWVQLQEGEDDKTYFNRVWKQATQTNAGIAFRRGGGSYLGLRCKASAAKPCLRAWEVAHVPCLCSASRAPVVKMSRYSAGATKRRDGSSSASSLMPMSVPSLKLWQETLAWCSLEHKAALM